MAKPTLEVSSQVGTWTAREPRAVLGTTPAKTTTTRRLAMRDTLIRREDAPTVAYLMLRDTEAQLRRLLVTVAGHPRDELHPKTQGSIMRQAGLTR
jgi:hypothetical protein